METHFGRAARSLKFNAFEWDVVIGSLLGDGTLLRTTAGYCFRDHHGLEQKLLVDWKYQSLRRFVRTPPNVSGSGYYFRTVTHPELTALRTEFYEGLRKVVPLDLLQQALTPRALATWIMDDGAADGRQLRINTQSFSETECRGLVSLLERLFGLRFTINYDKGKPRLRCAAGSMERLRAVVGPHILPSLSYKIKADYPRTVS
jgi:hypothetical protein